jgi:predicted transcriptional regulator
MIPDNEYDFSIDVNDAINDEVNKFTVNEQHAKVQTTVKPIMRKTYPKEIVTSDGEIKEASGFCVLEETELVEFKSTNFVLLSKEAIVYLIDNLTATENKRFNKIQNDTRTYFNIIFNGQYPHNTTSLMKHLGLSHKQFERFIRKLKNKGILYVIKGVSPKTRKVQNTYIINPFISRKRKNIHKDLCTIFADVQTLNKSL